jgi:tetratricopeptide (TPR) repeat protein
MKRTKRTDNQKQISKEPKKGSVTRSSPNFTEQHSNPKRNLLFILIISVLSLIAYYPSFKGELTNWDDNRYLTENPYLKSLSAENIKAIFAEDSYMGNYHPLTLLSLAIDYRIGGQDADGNINPQIYHIVNFLLHLLTTLLVFFFVSALLKNSKAAFVAALLFGVHTLHVESVAWISERKDVLYAAFFMASLVAYLKYLTKKQFIYYGLALFLFVLSLLAKGQAVSLAVSLVVIDFFYKRKILSAKVIIEKLPFFILALIFGILAIKAQESGEALVVGESYNFLQRISIAAYGFTMYLLKLILPLNLSAIYPYPDIINQTVPLYYTLSIAVVIAVAFAFWKSLKKSPVAAFGIAFFVVNIALLLQLIPVGSAVYADRYAYIPSVGFYIIVAYFLVKLTKYKTISKTAVYAVLGVYVLVLTALTFERSKVWQSSEALWDDTVEKSPEAVVARNNRGSLKNTKAESYAEENRYDLSVPLRKEAIQDFDIAIREKPDYVHALYNRGATKLELGKNTNDTSYIFEALDDFDRALQIDPLFAEAYHNRGNTKSELNDLEGALSDYNNAVDLEPQKAEFYINRGVNLGKMGRLEQAVEDISQSLEIEPENPSAYANRGRAYAGMGNYEEAIENYTIALEYKPDFVTAYFNRAIALWRMEMKQAAIEDFTKALEINPDFSDAYVMRGRVYLENNNKLSACSDFKIAADLGNQHGRELFSASCQ